MSTYLFSIKTFFTWQRFPTKITVIFQVTGHSETNAQLVLAQLLLNWSWHAPSPSEFIRFWIKKMYMRIPKGMHS